MRSISLVLLLGVVAFTCGFLVTPKPDKVTGKDFLLLRKSILELLQHINQYEILPELYEQTKTYRIEDHIDFFTNSDAVREFVELYRSGHLRFNEIFSIYNEHLSQEDWALFRIFFHANDFKSFYRILQWIRFNVNSIESTPAENAPTNDCLSVCLWNGIYNFPSFRSCNRYIHCIHGFQFDVECPRGEEFDHRLLRCVREGTGRCILEGIPESSAETA